MNYEKLYNNFIEKFKVQRIPSGSYTERHHILPRYAGGTNDESNLVTVTYRQHRFLHRVLYKARGNLQDKLAYQLMSGIPVDKKQVLCTLAGKAGGAKNRESGHIAALGRLTGPRVGAMHRDSGFLDQIRHLANNPERQAKLKQLNDTKRETGSWRQALEKAWKANEGREWTHGQCEAQSHRVKERVQANPEQFRNLAELGQKARSLQTEACWLLKLNEVTVRNSEFLTKRSCRSKYSCTSPEGLVFDSVTYAAEYYGLPTYVVDNWIKRGQYGWCRNLKQA